MNSLRQILAEKMENKNYEGLLKHPVFVIRLVPLIHCKRWQTNLVRWMHHRDFGMWVFSLLNKIPSVVQHNNSFDLSSFCSILKIDLLVSHLEIPAQHISNSPYLQILFLQDYFNLLVEIIKNCIKQRGPGREIIFRTMNESYLKFIFAVYRLD